MGNYKKGTCTKCNEYYKDDPEKHKMFVRRAIIKRRDVNLEYLKTRIELKCSICGYDKCFAALDFHHKDSSQKENRHDSFSYWVCFSLKRFIAKWEEMKNIVEIVCANCHREIHNNMATNGDIMWVFATEITDRRQNI